MNTSKDLPDAPRAGRFARNRVGLGIGSLALLAAVGGGTLLLRPNAVAQVPIARTASGSGRTLAVQVIRARTVLQSDTRILSGQVEAYQVATLSAQVAEVVTQRPVQKGDRVAPGAVLAAFDDRTARTTLQRAIAAAAQATAARRQVESQYAQAVIETKAAQQQASASLQQATVGEQKARTYTRRQELRQALAALDQVRSDEHLARIEAERYRILVAQGAVAQQTLDQRDATLDATIARRHSAEEAVSLAREGARQEDIETAAAQVRTARAGVQIAGTRPQRLASLRAQIESLRAVEAQTAAQVRQAQIDLSKHQIRAPFAGRVLATLIEAGERTVPGTPLVKFGSTDRVKVTFALPEDDRASVALGRKMMVFADALPGLAFSGTLTALSSAADEQTRTFPVEVTVANPGERLLPGMVARLNLTVGAKRRVVTVPVGATMAEDGQTHVFVVKDGVALRRTVTLGATDGQNVQIVSGLFGGETIAATPQRLTDGVSVQEAAR